MLSSLANWKKEKIGDRRNLGNKCPRESSGEYLWANCPVSNCPTNVQGVIGWRDVWGNFWGDLGENIRRECPNHNAGLQAQGQYWIEYLYLLLATPPYYQYGGRC